MSLSDYDFLPKVTEETPCFDKSDVTSLATPKSLRLPVGKLNDEGQGSLNGSGCETERLLATDPLTTLVSSETLASSVLKKTSPKEWEDKCPKNLTLSSTLSRSPGHSTYVRTPQPVANSDTAFKLTGKSHTLRNKFVTAALRSAQNVPQERLQRENDLKQLKRNRGAVVPLKGLDSDDTSIGCIGRTMVVFSYFLIVLFFPVAIIFCLRVSVGMDVIKLHCIIS